MRIILVNKFHYLKGGSETYYFGLAEGLKKVGHEVHFFAMQDEKNLPCGIRRNPWRSLKASVSEFILISCT
jgi:multimeric flavodoxin WrbA